MGLYVGTSGFAYKEWKGPFYPADLADARMLRYYGERFGTVEINNTFYRMPKTSVVESWAAEVPPDFRFVLKASQRITHFAGSRRRRPMPSPTPWATCCAPPPCWASGRAPCSSSSRPT